MKQIAGKKFGRLTAISPSHKNTTGHKWYWNCICDCGNKTKSLISRLLNGKNRSCGCLLNDWNQEQTLRHNPDKDTYRNYKKSAKKRGFDFELSLDQFSSLIHSPCHYCGGQNGTRNGIDRKDNSIGYTNANSLPCCKECNMAKGTLTYESFIYLVVRIHKHFKLVPVETR